MNPDLTTGGNGGGGLGGYFLQLSEIFKLRFYYREIP